MPTIHHNISTITDCPRYKSSLKSSYVECGLPVVRPPSSSETPHSGPLIAENERKRRNVIEHRQLYDQINQNTKTSQMNLVNRP